MSTEKELEKNPAQLKKYILRKLGKVQDEVRAVIENTELDAFISTPVRYRHPWELLWGNISKGGVCVAGDALHPMTPDIGQGGCAALEDGVVLARCLGEALLKNRRQEIRDKDEERKEECKRIEMGLRNYASKRKWRSIDLIITSYVFYLIQEIDGKVMSFLRNKFFSPILPWLLLKKADFDCWGLEVVLESWDSLRTTGFVLNTWTNAWKALEAIGVADALRLINYRFRGVDHEVRCVQRKLLLDSLANELSSATTRFSSKVVSIEESGYFKLLHLADGTILKVKRVLVGCDGVNSVVAKWLNFKQQSWNPAQLRQFVLSKLGKIPDAVRATIENTELDAFISSPLRYKPPWEVLWGQLMWLVLCRGAKES
ncbi:putative 6-hydroxynicotinate 3-monooxygenase [Rosa chinensis]|uniref:Putative 6-hydroxynicotinate 3-monooxygenase n=1 Tax=Rosa chinensis TaxID=74649 RepID=A0A2P6PSS6_ROSCH|nr:putative 6-hydroxynicotinate 3-monooxygenase [Rosa chinensis]